MRSIIKLCDHPGNSNQRNYECSQVIPAVLDDIQKTRALINQKKTRHENKKPSMHIDHLHVSFIGDYFIGKYSLYTVNW